MAKAGKSGRMGLCSKVTGVTVKYMALVALSTLTAPTTKEIGAINVERARVSTCTRKVRSTEVHSMTMRRMGLVPFHSQTDHNLLASGDRE